VCKVEIYPRTYRYFEWLKKGKERLPHFTKHANGNLMLLAGLYDRVVLEGTTEPLYTFTIVTTAANKDFGWLHDRQPVILSSMDALDAWLDTSSQKWTADLHKILYPYNDEKSPLACYQVPKEVGKVGTESITFIQPIAERKDGIEAMFARQKGGSTSQAPSPAKRKRSLSPPVKVSKAQRTEDEPADAKPKAEKVNAWEDSSDIEYIDDPKAEQAHTETKLESSQSSAPSTSQGTPKKRTAKTTKTLTPKKSTKGSKTESSRKITSFFSKT